MNISGVGDGRRGTSGQHRKQGYTTENCLVLDVKILNYYVSVNASDISE